MPNKNTFDILPIKRLLFEEIKKDKNIIVLDPFSNGYRNYDVTYINNDLNPELKCDYNMDALDFLKLFDNESVDVVVYDPPYSSRQVVECYKGFGIGITQDTTKASWRAKHLDEIARILKVGGKAICFGWNTNGVGKKRGFEMNRVLIVAHGGSKNDTLVTVESKVCSYSSKFRFNFSYGGDDK